MKKNLLKPAFLLLSLAAFACQSGTEEDKSLASTHPELEKQLARDSVPTPISSDENPGLYDQYRITLQEYESSGKYGVQELYHGRMSELNEAGSADARTYRSAFREGMKAGVNFAGKYTVVSVGCGTGCQTHYVIDRESGDVLDKVQSSMGARFNANSRLLILNPPDSTVDYSQCRNCSPQAYEFVDGKLKKIESTH